MALKAHQITIKVKVSHIIHATYTRHTAHMVNYSQVKNCLDMIPIIWSTFELTEFTWYIMQLSLPHHCFSKSTVHQFDIKIRLNQSWFRLYWLWVSYRLFIFRRYQFDTKYISLPTFASSIYRSKTILDTSKLSITCTK